MSDRKEKFTPGPWKAHAGIMEPDYVYIGEEEHCDEENRVVCECFLRPRRLSQSADVHLIAAAPEMYYGNGDAMETIWMIEHIGEGICASCPWGRKCKTCAMSEIFRLTHRCEKTLKKIQKKARGEK